MILGGLTQKFDRAKGATESYLNDRVEQTEEAAISYAVAAGLYAAAGVFAIATLLVIITAGFRWIELRYGLFYAFAASGALLLVFIALSVGLAVRRLNRPAKKIPSLGSRLRVAITSSPSKSDVASAAALSELSDSRRSR
jgi:hypothetical protein